MASGIRRRARSTMRPRTLRPLVHDRSQRPDVALYARLVPRWCSTEGAALAAAATLVAVAFALSHARPLAGRPAPPRAGVDASRWPCSRSPPAALWWGAGDRLEPGRRSGSSSCSAPSSTCRGWRSARLPAGWAPRSATGRRRRSWRSLSAFAAGVMAVAPLAGAVPADGLPKGSRPVRAAAPRPRRGGLGRGPRSSCIGGALLVGVAAAGAAATDARPDRRRAPGRLALGNVLIAARHAHPVGQRHARRPAR